MAAAEIYTSTGKACDNETVHRSTRYFVLTIYLIEAVIPLHRTADNHAIHTERRWLLFGDNWFSSLATI